MGKLIQKSTEGAALETFLDLLSLEHRRQDRSLLRRPV